MRYNIDGVVFDDVDGNGVMDAGEAGVSGVEVTLSDGSITSTTADGYYIFANYLPGDYTVTVTTPEGFLDTTPNPVGITITDADVTVDFGIYNPPPTAAYSIGGVTFLDANGNGVWDGNEFLSSTYLDSVTLSDGRVIYVPDNGYYLFEDCAPGDYTVTYDVGPPPGSAVPVVSSPNPVAITVINSDVTVNFGWINTYPNPDEPEPKRF